MVEKSSGKLMAEALEATSFWGRIEKTTTTLAPIGTTSFLVAAGAKRRP